MNGTIQTIIITGIIFLLSACANPPMVSPEENLPETSSAESASPQEITEPAMADSQEIDTAQQPVATPAAIVESVSQSPLAPPTVTPLAEEPPTPDVSQSQPPLCEVKNSSETALLPSQLDKFIFSEPKVIFSQEAPIEIIEWLPDNQRVLIHVRNQTKQSIEVLDTVTEQTEIYADNLENARNIHWLTDEEAVVYTNRQSAEFSGIDQDGVWISYRDQREPQFLSDYGSVNNRESVSSQLPVEVVRKMKLPDGTFDPEQWRYTKERSAQLLELWADVPFQVMVNEQQTKAIAFGPPWMYLVDLKTGQPCELVLGNGYYPFDVAWSADGRFLAMLVSNNHRNELMSFNELTVFDTETGRLYNPDSKLGHIWDMAWFPDNRHLFVSGEPQQVDNAYQNEKIVLIDVSNELSSFILSDYIFGGGQAGFQLALSKDGNYLVAKCPNWSQEKDLIVKNQVCLVSIKLKY